MSHSRLRNGARIGFALLILSLFTPLLLIFPAEAQSVVMRFAVIGDYGNNSSEEIAVANMVKSWNPSFIITTGDNNYRDGEASTIDNNIGQHYSAYIGNYQGTYGDGSPTNRFFPSLGNHDWIASGATPYLNYFTLPGNERYYDFTWGPVHFFSIDSDGHEPDGTSASSTQANWLRTRLAASTSQFQVVYFHHPPYGSSSVHSPSTTMRWPFQQWGADMVLSGHNHQYERLNVNGLTYIVNGLGGTSRYGFGNPVPESIVRYNNSWGAQLVTVYNCQMVFEFWSIAGGGTLIDSYTLGTCGGSPSATPSSTPTTIPTTAPTQTVNPTALPTLVPSATQTLNPTTNPTLVPSATQTLNPTTNPTLVPSVTQTSVPTVVPTLPPVTPMTVLADADAYIDFRNKRINFGSDASLLVSDTRMNRSYLHFTVPALTGTLSRAVLQVYATSPVETPFSLATINGTWSESSLIYQNAPELGTILAFSPTGSANSWIEIDVTSYVRSAGSYDFVMVGDNRTVSSFSSREGGNAPRLLLSFETVASPTSPPPIAPTVNPSATLASTATTPPIGGTVRLNPIGDAYVNSENPTDTFGTDSDLRTDNSPMMRSYLRFDVPAGTIVSATLRVYATSDNELGYTIQSSNTAWDEATISFNNAPEPSGSYGSSGEIASTGWTEVDVSSLVMAGGSYSIVLSSSSDTRTAFDSREAGNAPELVIVYASAASANPAQGSIIVPTEASSDASPGTGVIRPANP